jgi:hypothetical protein
MADTNETRYNSGNPICDALRFLSDASLAIWPADVAARIAEVEKNFWGGVRWFAEKNIKWVDESLLAAEHLRREWCKRPATETPHETTESI